jgi:hypothetical protein
MLLKRGCWKTLYGRPKTDLIGMVKAELPEPQSPCGVCAHPSEETSDHRWHSAQRHEPGASATLQNAD